MTLAQYLDAVAQAPESEVRAALTTSLVKGPPRRPADFDRFYRRVVSELERQGRRLPAVA